MSFLNRLYAFFKAFQNLIFISLSFFLMHVILRVFLLFRANPYGFPFVSKPDWYIFHAVCIDYLWIFNVLVFFFILIFLLQFLFRKKTNSQKFSKILTCIFIGFHAIILAFTLLDNELQRFLGSHLSFGIINTYKDTSSLKMFYDYVANDYSVPFLQFILLLGMWPLIYVFYKFIFSKIKINKKWFIGFICFYLFSFVFLEFIWTGNARMTKLKPIVSLVYSEIFNPKKTNTLSEEDYLKYSDNFKTLWYDSDKDSLWIFPTAEKQKGRPFYKEPSKKLLNDSILQKNRKEQPNFIVIFLESHRALNVGFLNKELHLKSTPFLDSLAMYSRVFSRMHASGLPTTGGVLSTHTGILHHSVLAEATELAHVFLPSFASVLTDFSYETNYFSAADPAWDNLGVWVSKWYKKTHYDRNLEDDSVFFDNAASYILDSLATKEKPFLATLITRSNHYPFNFAAGLSPAQKEAPLQERINYTMNYTDRQLQRFFSKVRQSEKFKNTYVLILADHGFPLGENGISTMNGGGFSNATWIPCLIYGKDMKAFTDTISTSQIDLAPTILELAGIAVPNIFMGHSLFSASKGISLGAYSKVAAISYNNFRLIERYPLGSASVDGLFKESDTRQNENLKGTNKETEEYLSSLLKQLIAISDYSLERGF